MKIMEKLKNALFEEEYVEIEEKPKAKPKKEVHKEKIKQKGEKPIAQKISVSDRAPKEEKKQSFEMVEDDKDEVLKERELLKSESDFKFPIMAEEDFSITQPIDILEDVPKKEEKPPVPEIHHEEKPLYQSSKKENDYQDYVKKDYAGAYEKKQEHTGFKPSPIISPIYGVLDKNYKKEEVKEKREVRISSFSRDELDVDAVRRKAYGDLTDDLQEFPRERRMDEVLEEQESLLMDLSNEEPLAVNKVTVGDAEEYFEDLGLEYNKDYVDASKEKATGRRVKEHEKEEQRQSEVDDDNLFDLIDSMYNEE